MERLPLFKFSVFCVCKSVHRAVRFTEDHEGWFIKSYGFLLTISEKKLINDMDIGNTVCIC